MRQKTGNGKYYAYGLAIGTLIGWAMGNMALGLIIGTASGLSLDLVVTSR
ncbi:hypothetical protein [Vibrio eleionomae]|nr:hypothetical protein [Vibrio eleionomae]